MFAKIKDVIPLQDYILQVYFENGDLKKYDVKNLFDCFETFASLKNITGLFEQVKVDEGGYGISWNEDIDLSCDELFVNGY